MTPPTTSDRRAARASSRIPTWALVGGLLVIAAAVILLTYWQFRRQGTASAVNDPQQLRSSVESAAGYLATTELRGDDAWVATQGASKLGPAFRTWAETLEVAPVVESDLQRDPLASRIGAGIEGRLWGLRWLAAPNAPRVPAPNVSPADAVSNAISEAEIQGILRVMALTVMCSELGASDRQEWLDHLAADTHSYLLTHQLLAVMLGQQRGCLDEATADGLRRRLATRLWTEQTADRSGIHDLSIERMAILCYAQVCDWLRPEWIDELVAQQQPDGSWGELNPNVHPRVVARPEHTAALAFYVLASTWNERFAAEAGPVPPKRQ